MDREVGRTGRPSLGAVAWRLLIITAADSTTSPAHRCPDEDGNVAAWRDFADDQRNAIR